MKNDETSPHLTATIVSSYVRHNAIGANQLSDLITTVHRTLAQLGEPTQAEGVLVPAVSPKRSVQHDFVVCLDCGYRGTTLRRHISTRHGLTRNEYIRRWGLPHDHRLTAPAYSERRSEMAKSAGLGRKFGNRGSTATATPKTGSRAAAKTSDASQVAAATPARRGRPRARAV